MRKYIWYELNVRKINEILYGVVSILVITRLVTYFYHAKIVGKINGIMEV